jgi:hypothetical protein
MRWTDNSGNVDLIVIRRGASSARTQKSLSKNKSKTTQGETSRTATKSTEVKIASDRGEGERKEQQSSKHAQTHKRTNDSWNIYGEIDFRPEALSRALSSRATPPPWCASPGLSQTIALRCGSKSSIIDKLPRHVIDCVAAYRLLVNYSSLAFPALLQPLPTFKPRFASHLSP